MARVFLDQWVLSCAGVNSAIVFSWNAVTSADVYRVSIDDGTGWREPIAATSTSYVFRGLAWASVFSLSVQAGKNVGSSVVWSSTASRSCETPFRSVPTGLECERTATSVDFSWDPVPGATSYTVVLEPQVTGGVKRRVEQISEDSVEFVGLSPSSSNILSVFADVGGRPQLPGEIKCVTSSAVADPDPPVCSAVGDDSVTLSWGADSRVHQWYVARVTTGDSYVDGVMLGSSVLSKKFAGLASDRTYSFRFCGEHRAEPAGQGFLVSFHVRPQHWLASPRLSRVALRRQTV